MSTYLWLDQHIAINLIDRKPPTYPRANVIKNQSIETGSQLYEILSQLYEINVAVAGISPDALSVNLHNQIVTISHIKNDTMISNDWERLFTGISNASFELKFLLAEQVNIISSTLINGVLTIKLEWPNAISHRKQIPITVGTTK